MKKLAVISLIIMFLTGQYAFASRPYENLPQTGSEAQGLTQEQADEILIELINAASAGDTETLLEQIEKVNNLLESPMATGACLVMGIFLIIIGNFFMRTGNPSLQPVGTFFITWALIFIFLGC